MKKFYLVHNRQTQKNEILETKERPKVEGTKYSNCSGGFDTLARLKDHNDIPDYVCCKCGGPISLSYMNKEYLKKRKMCFHCNFWQHIIENPKGKIIIIDGNVYVNGKNASTKQYFKGFSGHHFIIKLFSGEIISTNNLWHNGEIPKRFLSDLPDNAKFISK